LGIEANFSLKKGKIQGFSSSFLAITSHSGSFIFSLNVFKSPIFMPLSFDPLNSDLPIVEIIPQLKKEFSSGNSVILSAPPGAGKSTLLPLALLEEKWLAGKKIIMLEPRRLAAKTVALRMADLLNEAIGKRVGYRIRFENRVSSETVLEVVTEGILTRMLQSDNALENVALVIFDEFHERSLHADLALALCRESQQVLRPDLRILIMSATLNISALKDVLNAPVLISEGRQFPVEINYTEDADERMLPEFTSQSVLKAVKENEGDILVFLPGEAEIRKCEDILVKQIPSIRIHPLYGQLTNQEQNAAILPDKNGKRKIVLATSIAETSLTIEGIKVVVDCGFSRVSKFDIRSGLSKLETVRVSKDSADQRAGRAGRLSAGVCYRMWTAATHSRLAEHRVPEIMESDLSSLVLEMALWGVQDILKLTWLSPPPISSLAHAKDTLEQIGAFENAKITAHGKQIQSLACHPRIAHMLLMARAENEKQLACDIAAMLEERDPLGKEAGIDINLRIEALRRYRRDQGKGGKYARIEKAAAAYRSLLKVEIDNEIYDSNLAGLLIAYAFPERIASARPGNNAQFQLANGRYAMFSHQDDLAHSSWLAVANMDLREGMGKIFLASPVDPKDLVSFVKEQENISWDSRKGGLITAKELRMGSVVLQSKPITNADPENIIQVISNAISEDGEQLLHFDDSFDQLLNRISSLIKWNGKEDWPDTDKRALLLNNKNWLGPYLFAVRKNEDLKKINLSECLYYSLNSFQQQQLDQLAPEKLEVPSGSMIRIQYVANGGTPILSVRLQEVFGLSETPKVNKGKMPVVMHLLSPGYKPVQITSDLKSFWNNLYQEVKSELRRRYPKHSWPEDPWTAPAVKKGRSEKN
jgi:ATP-dependent helicase HrpB